jgi:molecular chaperone GrpE
MKEDKKMDQHDTQEKVDTEQHATNAAEPMNGDEINEKEKPEKKPFISGKKTNKKYEEKITSLEEKLNELNDKYLRLFSEFDNYRKRTNKERLELLKTAGEDVIISLLPVLDDFDRAIAVLDKNKAAGADVEGIKLISNKLLGILKKNGLEPMNAIGQPFDTDFHEALTTIPAPGEEMKEKVIDEIEKGYLLNGKVIRFAKVVVGQ